MNIKIDLAKPSDAANLQEVYYRTWLSVYPNEEYGITKDDIEYYFKDAFSEETIKTRQKGIADLPSNHIALVARDGDKAIGICRIILHPDKNQLKAIYILPEYQGRGIGKMFWEEAKKYLNKNKDTIVHVATYNKVAIAFYERLGFKDTGKRFSEERFRMKSGSLIPEMEMVIGVK